MMPRLNAQVSSCDKLGRSDYQADDHGVGIVHLGIGAFHRAHQAVFTEHAIAESGGDWRIIGVSLRSAGVRDQMNPQDCRYTLTERSSLGNNKHHLMSVIKNVLVAPENPDAVVKLLSDVKIRIVSLTVTEKGYCYDVARAKLNTQLPDIQSDLNNVSQPKTMPGFIVAACQQRKAAGTGGFTVLSCDNLGNNGQIARQVVTDFAEQVDLELKTWIEENVTFPSTMVDRIVPATTDSDRESISKTLGFEDLAAVNCEPYKQWVIEDNFAAGRPVWEKAGALLVKDVRPFETMKLRLLNGNHSSLAYLGYLSGHEFIHQAINDPDLHSFIRYLIKNEVKDSLSPPSGFEVEAYAEEIIARFENAGICYKTSQVASDGSQKLPQRLLETASENILVGRSTDGIALIIAGWFRYMQGTNDDGSEIPVSDPMAVPLKETYEAYKADYDVLVKKLIDSATVFNEQLTNNDNFVSNITYWLQKIAEQGAKQTIIEFNNTH